MMNVIDDLAWVAELVNKGGGWAAFLAFLFFGGRAFMSLARDFCNKVVTALDKIEDAIVGQEKRVDMMTERLANVHVQVAQQGEKIERLAQKLSGKAESQIVIPNQK